jgi:hypothetical protein
MAKTTQDADSKITSVTLLPTGRIILATEKRVYEVDAHGVWQPMLFAVPEPPAPDPVTTKPGLFSTPAAATPVPEPVA